MRLGSMVICLWLLLGLASPAHADPGLSSLEGLWLLYFAALAVFCLIFYALPAWLILRARRLCAGDGLSTARLLRLIAPAIVVGGLGWIDFLGPLGLVSAVVHGATGGFEIYWVFLLLNTLLLVAAGSTYRHCKNVRPRQ